MKKVINLFSKIGDMLVVSYDILEFVILPLILLLASGVILEVIMNNHLGWRTNAVWFFMAVGTYTYLYYVISKVTELFYIKKVFNTERCQCSYKKRLII
jgi:hypothetical protein